MVADSGLMNNANIAELEAHGYKYIIGGSVQTPGMFGRGSGKAAGDSSGEGG